MRKTALNAWHVERGATMVDFNGWHMPLYYTGITAEHHHTRHATGLFDLCHMGRVILRGQRVREFVDFLTPAKVSAAVAGQIDYSFLLRDDGTTIDDITLYYAADYIMLVINAGNRDRDVEWIRQQAVAFDVEVEDKSDTWGMIALQGPRADDILTAVFGRGFTLPDYYHFVELNDVVSEGPLLLSSTGYTGERGVEIYLPVQAVEKVWQLLLAAEPTVDCQPIGLGARDSLRLEAGMALYGHELDDSTTPLHAGLSKFVHLDQGDFIGREALVAQKQAGRDRKLIGFEMLEKGPIARQGFNICNAAGEVCGKVTSGISSPTLNKTVGMGYIATDAGKIGDQIFIDIRGRQLPARIVRRPFYRRNG